jgi:nucleotide-binding universal stress UspA family protein
MENAKLLVVLGKSAKVVDLEPLCESAIAGNLHLSIVIIGTMPPVPVYTYGVGGFSSYALPFSWQGELDSAKTELNALRTAISDYGANQGASADVRVIIGEPTALSAALAHAALTSDLVLLGDDLRDDDRLFGDVLRTTLFLAPAGVMINAMKSKGGLQPKSVFVAWNEGLPAARAVHAALPILRSAKDVTVAIFDPVTTHWRDSDKAGWDVAAWLNHQGCDVTVQPYPTGGEYIGTLIPKRAAEIGADLIVMGAYNHSRWRETIFGGTTRTMIEQRDVPVLLCH